MRKASPSAAGAAGVAGAAGGAEAYGSAGGGATARDELRALTMPDPDAPALEPQKPA